MRGNDHWAVSRLGSHKKIHYFREKGNGTASVCGQLHYLTWTPQGAFTARDVLHCLTAPSTCLSCLRIITVERERGEGGME
jgi:hypothetical protein